MADLLLMKASERGVVRVFSVDIDNDERQQILNPRSDTAPTGAALGALLGVEWIDPDHADLFDVSELDELGLIGFLSQGAGISDHDLETARGDLDVLKGTILILYSRAIEGDADLNPLSRVTPVICLQEASKTIKFESLPSKGADGDLNTDLPSQKSPHLTLLAALLALPILVLIVGSVIWAVFG